MYDEDELTKQCLEMFDENADEVLKSDDFTQLHLRTLNLLLAREFYVEKEIHVFEAVERWSEAECQRKGLSPEPQNKRKVLGDALYLVRMPLMSADEFTKGPVKSKMLTADEALSVFTNPFNEVGESIFPSQVSKFITRTY